MITVTNVLFADTQSSELAWEPLSIRYMLRLDHGTQLELIF
jgi:hypothetical protein